MFERFSRAARTAVRDAVAEAAALGHDRAGTGHLLLAMLADDTGPVARVAARHGVDAGRVRAELRRRVGPPTGRPAAGGPDDEAADAAALKAIGIDLAEVRRAIERTFGPGALHLPRDTPPPRRRGPFARLTAGHPGYSRRARTVLELSLREAVRLRHSTIGPEHLALGILREGRGVGARILADAGVDTAALRADLARAAGSPAA